MSFDLHRGLLPRCAHARCRVSPRDRERAAPADVQPRSLRDASVPRRSTAAAARSDLVDERRQIAAMIRKRQSDKAVAVLKKHFDDAVVTLGTRQSDAEEGAG